MDKRVTLQLNHIEAGSVVGKIVNVYNSHANAIAFGATGLVTVKAVNPVTGVIGTAISQTAGIAGPAIDVNGALQFGVDDAADIYLMCRAGRWGGPLRMSRMVLGHEIS